MPGGRLQARTTLLPGWAGGRQKRQSVADRRRGPARRPASFWRRWAGCPSYSRSAHNCLISS